MSEGHAHFPCEHLMANLPVLWLDPTHGEYRQTQKACHLWCSLPERLAWDQQGLTPSVWSGLGESAGPCSGWSEPAARTCAAESSHVLISPAASCEEKRQRSGAGPALWPFSHSSRTCSFDKSPACRNVRRSWVHSGEKFGH